MEINGVIIITAENVAESFCLLYLTFKGNL
jgi:hypothetical protein